MPVKVRARLVALTSCGYAVGGVLAAILGKGLIVAIAVVGVIAVALINHNVSASTHHIDAVAERGAEPLASAAAKLARA